MTNKIQKRWYLGAIVALAFLSFISGAQIDSARADANNLNTLYWILCPLFAVAAFVFIYLASKTPKA